VLGNTNALTHDKYREKVSRYSIVSCTTGIVRTAWGLGQLDPLIVVLTPGCPL